MKLLASLAASVYGQIILDGACPTVKGQENFDTERYMGKWYSIMETEGTYSTAPNAIIRCTTAEYDIVDESTISVNNTSVQQESVDGSDDCIESIFDMVMTWMFGDLYEPREREVRPTVMTERVGGVVGTGVVVDPADPTALYVSFDEVIACTPEGQCTTFPFRDNDEEPVPNYRVIETDYENYAIVHSCEILEDGQHSQRNYILGRDRQMIVTQPDIISAALRTMNDVGISTEEFPVVDQSGCEYYSDQGLIPV